MFDLVYAGLCSTCWEYSTCKIQHTCAFLTYIYIYIYIYIYAYHKPLYALHGYLCAPCGYDMHNRRSICTKKWSHAPIVWTYIYALHIQFYLSVSLIQPGASLASACAPSPIASIPHSSLMTIMYMPLLCFSHTTCGYASTGSLCVYCKYNMYCMYGSSFYRTEAPKGHLVGP